MFKQVWDWMYDRPASIAFSVLLVLALATCIGAKPVYADRIDDLGELTPYDACQVRARLLHTGMSIRGDNGPDSTVPKYIEFHQQKMADRYPEWEWYNENELAYIGQHFQQGWDYADEYMRLMETDKLSKAYHQEKTDKFFNACLNYTGAQPDSDTSTQPDPGTAVEMKFIKVQSENMGTEYTYEGLFNRTMGCVAHNMPIYFETCMQKSVDDCVAENHAGVFSESQSGQLIMDCKRMVGASDLPIMCKDRAKDKAFKCLNLFPPVEDYGVDCEGIPNQPKGGSIDN